MPRNSASALPAVKLASSAANPGVAVGDVVGGKYRVDGELAEGGMGIVLVATHLELDCPVALKLIRPEHLANETVVERLLSEARIAASLHSKHVNRILDVGRTGSGVPYLVLEYMAGSDLYSYLQRRGQLPVTEAVDYVLQVCEALAEAHAIGIVHRDLKPENVFLSEEADGGFTVKVLDFGISKAPRRRGVRTVTSTPFAIIGSPTYMSPEQVRGMEVDNRADIWALGALLHELCTGDALFEAPSMARTFVKITDEAYFPESYGKSQGATLLHQVVCRCLRRNRDERYRDVVELARELGPLGTDSTQAARVAKVATASRARVIAASGDEAPETTTTPLVMTRAELEPSESVRPSWRWTLIGVAAVVPLALGLGYLSRAGRHAPDAATAPAAAAARSVTAEAVPLASQQSALAETLPLVAPSLLVAPAPLATRPTPGSAARPQVRWHVPKPPAPRMATRAPTRALIEPQPNIVAPAPSKPAADAWDPSSFGGRR